MRKIDKIYLTLKDIENKKKDGVSAVEICDFLGDDRPNISRLLNQLHKENKVSKYGTRPVFYNTIEFRKEDKNNLLNFVAFEELFGSKNALKEVIKSAKALLQYPPYGLNTILTGERGSGKKDFSKAMYRYARELGTFNDDSEYIFINAFEYKDNIDKLLFLLKPFEEIEGKLIKKPDRFIYLTNLDDLTLKDQNKLLVEIFIEGLTKSNVNKTLLIMGIKNFSSTLKDLYNQYIQHQIQIPNINKWTFEERLFLIEKLLDNEVINLNKSLFMEKKVVESLLLYKPEGNITQLKADIQWIVANAYLDFVNEQKEYLLIKYSHLAKHIAIGIFSLEENLLEIKSLLASKGEVIEYSHKGNSPSNSNEFLEKIIEQNIDISSYSKNNIELRKTLLDDLDKYLKDFSLDKSEKLEIDSSRLLKEVMEVIESDSDFSPYTHGVSRSKLIKHFEGIIYRKEKNINITYTKKKFLERNYSDAFEKSQKLTDLLSHKLGLLSQDEIAILSLFFLENEEFTQSKKVKIIVVCHGKGIATSMSDYVNERFGGELVLAFDLYDFHNFENLYDTLKSQITIFDEGLGVLLLVDMGELKSIQSLLEKELDNKIMTLSPVNLPLLLKAVNMSNEGYKLNTIFTRCNSVKNT